MLRYATLHYSWGPGEWCGNALDRAAPEEHAAKLGKTHLVILRYKKACLSRHRCALLSLMLQWWTVTGFHGMYTWSLECFLIVVECFFFSECTQTHTLVILHSKANNSVFIWVHVYEANLWNALRSYFQKWRSKNMNFYTYTTMCARPRGFSFGSELGCPCYGVKSTESLPLCPVLAHLCSPRPTLGMKNELWS